MADQSYVFFNSLIDVDLIKIDQNLNQTYEQAVTNKENMNTTTTLFNTFDGVIDAQYFSPEDPVGGASYTVYRRTPEQTYYDFVCVMTNGDYIFYDYNVKNNNYYHYLCSIEIETSTGPYYTIYQNRDENGDLAYIHTLWDEWSICDIVEGDPDENNTIAYIKSGPIWKFKANLEQEDLTQNTSVTIWDTLGAYPKISIGQKNYDSGSVTCLLGEVTEFTNYDEEENATKHYNYTEKINLNNRYSREMERLEAWREFCNNGNLKLLKDVKGNAWIVQITENPHRNINVKVHSMPTTISFDWVEVENIEGQAIIKIGNKPSSIVGESTGGTGSVVTEYSSGISNYRTRNNISNEGQVRRVSKNTNTQVR